MCKSHFILYLYTVMGQGGVREDDGEQKKQRRHGENSLVGEEPPSDVRSRDPAPLRRRHLRWLRRPLRLQAMARKKSIQTLPFVVLGIILNLFYQTKRDISMFSHTFAGNCLI